MLFFLYFMTFFHTRGSKRWCITQQVKKKNHTSNLVWNVREVLMLFSYFVNIEHCEFYNALYQKENICIQIIKSAVGIVEFLKIYSKKEKLLLKQSIMVLINYCEFFTTKGLFSFMVFFQSDDQNNIFKIRVSFLPFPSLRHRMTLLIFNTGTTRCRCFPQKTRWHTFITCYERPGGVIHDIQGQLCNG